MSNQDQTTKPAPDRNQTAAARSTKQVPTVGRIVHLHGQAVDGDGCNPLAAIIVGVNTPTNVNLAAFNTFGTQTPALNVEEGTEPGQWAWPPFVPAR